MQTYLATGHLQVVDLEMVVCEFYEEHPRIYAGLCGCSHVYGVFEGNQWGKTLVEGSLIWV